MFNRSTRRLIKLAHKVDGLDQAAWLKIFSGAGPLMRPHLLKAEPARSRLALNRMLGAGIYFAFPQGKSLEVAVNALPDLPVF